MKKTIEEFRKMLPTPFTLISTSFEEGMQSKVKIRNNDTGKIHFIKAENYIYLNKDSNRISSKMIEEECQKRNYSFIRKEKNKIILKRNKKEYSILISNFMSGMDPFEIGLEKRSKTRIDNSLKRFHERAKRDDIKDYEILEFTGMKKPMKVKHIPTNSIINIKSAQIFANGGYRSFSWDQEKAKYNLQQEFLEKFDALPDSKDYEIQNRGKLFYKNNKTPIKIKHFSCGNIFDSIPGNFLSLNNRCPFCALKGKSNKEIEVLEFIKSIYLDTIIHNYKLENTEIDIFIPEKKIGFEYNGLYWHSEHNGKDKYYHLNKTKLMEKHGYRLIHIFEDEWLNKQEIVKSKITHILRKNNDEKIYARKCDIRIITEKEKNSFLEENHIQGSDTSSIKLGLFLKNQLVSVMTFSKPRSGIGKNTGKKDTYELVRFASLKDKLIIGAFGKLLKYFLDNYPFERIITYADRRWSVDNNIYEKLKFKCINATLPNYWYADRNLRYHRYGFRKQVLKKKFPDIYDDNLTEFEIMNQTSFYRIWDCGNFVYEFTK